MLTRHTHHNVVWVDLESPTHEEVQELIGEYGIAPIVARNSSFPQ